MFEQSKCAKLAATKHSGHHVKACRDPRDCIRTGTTSELRLRWCLVSLTIPHAATPTTTTPTTNTMTKQPTPHKKPSRPSSGVATGALAWLLAGFPPVFPPPDVEAAARTTQNHRQPHSRQRNTATSHGHSPTTTTVRFAEPELLDASVAVYVTVCVPVTAVLKSAPLVTTETLPSTTSVADAPGSVHVPPTSTSMDAAPTNVTSGARVSTAATARVAVPTLPWLSVAVYDTVNWPLPTGPCSNPAGTVATTDAGGTAALRGVLCAVAPGSTKESTPASRVMDAEPTRVTATCSATCTVMVSVAVLPAASAAEMSMEYEPTVERSTSAT